MIDRISLLADAFADLARSLRSAGPSRIDTDVIPAIRGPDWHVWASECGRAIDALLNEGRIEGFRDRLTSTLAEGTLGQQAILAQAIDARFGPILGRGAAALNPMLAGAARIGLSERHRLNRGEGWVIPRHPLLGIGCDPGSGSGFPMRECDVDLFDNLLYIPSTLPAGPAGAADPGVKRQVRFRFAFCGDALPKGGADAPPPDGDEDIPFRVGFAPIAEATSDLNITCHRDGSGTARYAVLPGALEKRLAAVLRATAADGADLVLVPETTVPDWLKDSEIEALILGDGSPAPALKLVALGCGDQGVNRVRLFHGDGQPLLDANGIPIHQAKSHRWDLSAGQAARYNVPFDVARDAGDDYLREAIDVESDPAVIVCEIPSLGRVAVAICADFWEDQPCQWLRQNLFVDWTLVPLLDATLVRDNPRNWVVNRILAGCAFPDSRILIVNSKTLTHRQNRVNEARRAAGTLDVPAHVTTCGIAHLADTRETGRWVSRLEEVPTDPDAAPKPEEAVWRCITWRKTDPEWLPLPA